MARDRTRSLANTTILLIRHAERPDFGTGLSPAGQARARACVGYFRNFKPRGEGGGDPFRFDHLFAAADSAESERPSLTLAPLVAATGLAVDTHFKDKEFEALARHLRDHHRFADSNILICWHHEKILGLAGALGVDATTLPASSAWLGRWPVDVFGWLIQIGYDTDDRVAPDRTCSVNERLAEDDLRDPPGDSPPP